MRVVKVKVLALPLTLPSPSRGEGYHAARKQRSVFVGAASHAAQKQRFDPGWRRYKRGRRWSGPYTINK